MAADDLSLRGVNPAILVVDAELLVDADTPAELAELARLAGRRAAAPSRTQG